MPLESNNYLQQQPVAYQLHLNDILESSILNKRGRKLTRARFS